MMVYIVNRTQENGAGSFPPGAGPGSPKPLHPSPRGERVVQGTQPGSSGEKYTPCYDSTQNMVTFCYGHLHRMNLHLPKALYDEFYIFFLLIELDGLVTS